MSTEGIISIIIALILGIPSLITLFKINQTKVVYLEKQVINLKDDLLKNFNDLSIKYKGIEIEKKIYFISGFLVCQGKKDISTEKSKINICIPENSKWLDYKIVSNSKDMVISKKIENNEVSLEFDLFKSKEFLEYEGIIEIKEEIELNKTNKLLKFHHRIPNIPTINKFNIETIKSSYFLLILSFIIAFMPLFAAYEYNKLETYEITAYDTETDKELKTLYSSESLRSLEKKVAEETSGFKLFFDGKTKEFDIDLKEYYSKKKIKSVYFKSSDWGIFSWLFAIFLSALFILSILGIITSITLFYYQKRYLTLISK